MSGNRIILGTLALLVLFAATRPRRARRRASAQRLRGPRCGRPGDYRRDPAQRAQRGLRRRFGQWRGRLFVFFRFVFRPRFPPHRCKRRCNGCSWRAYHERGLRCSGRRAYHERGARCPGRRLFPPAKRPRASPRGRRSIHGEYGRRVRQPVAPGSLSDRLGERWSVMVHRRRSAGAGAGGRCARACCGGHRAFVGYGRSS